MFYFSFCGGVHGYNNIFLCTGMELSVEVSSQTLINWSPTIPLIILKQATKYETSHTVIFNYNYSDDHGK